MQIRKFRDALRLFKQEDPFTSAQLMEVFCTIAMAEGRASQDLEHELDIPKSTMSRHLAMLSKRYRKNYDGYDLIRLEENPEDRRSKLIYLTEKGKQFRDEITSI